MENVLKARIVADISDLKTGMAQAENSVEGFDQSAKRSIVTSRKTEVANTALARSYRNVGQNIKGATPVLQEFTRIVQDAPFGIIGMANNVQQFAGNFGQLAIQAGGAGNAVKIALKTMVTGINPAILAVTAITTAWTLYQQGVFDSKEETVDFADALEDFKKTLDGVSRATLEGAGNAEKEAQKFQLLRAQAENANVPLEKRIEAVKELQKDYPDYLGNLTQEQILTGKVGTAYDDLTKSIIATAKARAFSDEIAKNSLEALTIEERAQGRINQILEKRAQIEEANAKAESLQGKAGETARIERETAIGRAIRLEKEIVELGKEQVTDVMEMGKLNEENLRLQENITKQISEGAIFTKATKDGVDDGKNALTEFGKAQEEVNKRFEQDGKDALNKFNQELAETLRIQTQIETISKQIVETIDKAAKLRSEDPFGVMKNFPGQAPQEDKPDFYDPTKELDEIARRAQITEAAFDGLGAAIGRAFGGSREWGMFLSSFIKFAGEVIARNFAIAQSNAIVAATSSGAASGPAAAFVTPALITAGLALIGSLFAALGSSGGAVSSGSAPKSMTYSNIPGRANGGPVTAGKPYIVGERRAELFVPRTSGIIVPRIPDLGSDTSRSGGASTGKLVVEVVGRIENDHIRIANKRATNKVTKT